MKLLHTSDWHLGKSLYGRKRYHEFEAFLNWLLETIKLHQVDCLLVAGDVFDTATPGNRSQELYYRFLCQVAASYCRHLVVVAGNHDSASFINAPRELLKSLNIHVVGAITDDLVDELLVLSDRTGQPELIVCAVPFLRDRDIRVSEAGESFADKEQKMLEGINNHYQQIAELAVQQQQALGGNLPIVATGHLFTSGGQTIDGDGVRSLYVGSLAQVSAATFSNSFDYVALGHLHIPQLVAGSETIRYSGSPLPIGFGEARQQKQVCLVEFDGRQAVVTPLNVPVFQQLEQIKGDWDQINRRIMELVEDKSNAWLEVDYTGAELMGDLRQQLEQLVEGTGLELLRIKNNRIMNLALCQSQTEENLGDLQPEEVFIRCMAARQVPDDQQKELLLTYQELLNSLYTVEDQVAAP